MPTGVYLRSEKLRESQKRLKNTLGKHWKVKDSSRMGVKKGTIPWIKGKKHSEETKRKMSKNSAHNRYWFGKKRPPFSEKTRKNMSKAMKGEKSYLWKGGINPINDTIRGGIEFRLWRESIFARDNYICQKCFGKGGHLHPHHIFNFATYLDLRFAIDNGITLCEKCHWKFHRIYGRKNNTKEQLEEFFEEKAGKV